MLTLVGDNNLAATDQRVAEAVECCKNSTALWQ